MLESLTEKRRSGRQFEAEIIAHLRQNQRLDTKINLADKNGNPRSLAVRFDETLAWLRRLKPQEKSAANCYISQPVLFLPGIIVPESRFFPLATEALPGGRHPRSDSGQSL